jgi:DNA-binding response OmpR family regulator
MIEETILIVEDSDEIHKFLGQLVLERAGYNVLYAENGVAGLLAAHEHNPDLIIMDIHLPGKSGLDVLRELQDEGSTIPAIVMTSYGSEENILQALRLGAKDFIQKPFSRYEVLDAVEKALAELRWQRERVRMNQALEGANRQLQEQLTAWSNLNVIGQAITATLDETDVQRRLMWGINELMSVEAGSLFLLDEEKDELVLQITLKGMLERKGGFRLKMGRGIAGWVAQHEEPALVPDVRHDPRYYSQMDKQTGSIVRSVLAVPLKIKGKILGVLQVVNPSGAKEQFAQSDVELLEALAASVAVALENARLYAKMKDMVDLDVLQKTAQALARHLKDALTSLEGNLQLVNETLAGKPGDPKILATLATSQANVEQIAAAIGVIERITRLESEAGSDGGQLIDVEAALDEELRRLKATALED